MKGEERRKFDANIFRVRRPINAAGGDKSSHAVHPGHLSVQKAVSDDMNVENSTSAPAISDLVG